MSVRAKFKLDSYETFMSSGEECRSLKFSVVTGGSDENKSFWKYTPNGLVSLSTVNKSCWEQFEIGKEYYLDFTAAAVPEVSK